MKKLWFPVVIVVIWLLAFVAGPWYAGQKVEAKLDALLVNLSTNGILKFEKRSYDKGLFSSETEVAITMDMSTFSQALSQVGGSIDSPDAIVLKGEVNHGPFMFDDGFSFAVGTIRFLPEMTAEHKQEISKMFGTDEPLDLSIQFGWDDSVTTNGSLISFTVPEEGMTSQEAKLSVNLSDGGTHLVSDFNWGGLSVNKTDEFGAVKVDIGKVSFTSDSILALEELWIGASRFGILNVGFNGMGMEGQADNFAVTGKMSLSDNEEFVNGIGDMTLDKASMNGMDYVEDFNYVISFENLHAESLKKLAQAVREAQQAGGSPEAMQMAMGMQLMGILPEMVKQGMTISIDALEAKVMGEQVSSSLKIEVAKGTDVTQGMAAIAGVTAVADISVSKALLDNFPQFANPEMLQGLMQQGFFFEEDGFIKSHAEFKEGQLSVNGTVMPIPGLGM